MVRIRQFFNDEKKAVAGSYEEALIINLTESKYGEVLCDKVSQIILDQEDIDFKRFDKIFESRGLDHILIKSILKKYSSFTKKMREEKRGLEKMLSSLQEKI